MYKQNESNYRKMNIKKIQEKIELAMFIINKLTESICPLLVDNENVRHKAQKPLQSLWKETV